MDTTNETCKITAFLEDFNQLKIDVYPYDLWDRGWNAAIWAVQGLLDKHEVDVLTSTK